MTSRDIMVQYDEQGGLIVLRDGKDPHFIKRTNQNSVRCSTVMAKTLQLIIDDLAPLAKGKK